MLRSLVSRCSWLLVFVPLAPMARAQCTPAWQPSDGVPGVLGTVTAAVAWDPDGAGPLAERLVVGGNFRYAGTIGANRIAVFDPTTSQWSTLAAGFDGPVNAIVVRPNGELVVGGTFGGAFGAPGTAALAKWNGANWEGLAGGVNGWCNDLAVTASGDVIATGNFSSAGGTPASSIAQWNGTTWSALGSGLGTSFPVGNDLAVMANGDVVVSGVFTTAGAVPAQNLARWNGASWQAIPNSFTSVGDVASSPDGSLFALTTSLQRWDGTSWTTVTFQPPWLGAGTVMNATNGDLVIGGRFTSVDGVAATNLARWNGATWSAIAGANAPENALAFAEAQGTPYVGGDFLAAGSVVARGVARWQGGTWQALGNGAPSEIFAMTSDTAGRTVALARPSGLTRSHLLRRDGALWTSLGIPNPDAAMRTVVARDNGDLLIGGDADYQGGWRPLWRWNGSSFASVGNFLGGLYVPYVQCLLTLPDGSVLVGGSFESIDGIPISNVARWDGSTWSGLGTFAPATAQILAMTRLTNGDVVVAGSFSSVGGVAANNVARWNGTSWFAMGSGIPGFNGVLALVGTPNGGCIAGGSFSSPGNRLARWNGTSWLPLGTGVDSTVRSLALLPDGDVVVGGDFVHAGAVTVRGIARWNGTSLTPFGAGITVGSTSGVVVRSLLFQPDGALAVGGEFLEVNVAVAPNFAELRSPCQASSASFGSGCPSSGGNNTLTATLPWVEGTLRTTGTGLPTTAIVLTLTSVTSIAPGTTPLSLAFPQAGVGCDILVAPDLLGLVATTNGAASYDLGLPNTPPLVGVTFYQQMVPIELDGLGNWIAVTATNAVQLTAGQF